MGKTRTNATRGPVGLVGVRVYRAILMRQRNGTDVCELRHKTAHLAVAHLLDDTGLPLVDAVREYTNTLRWLKSDIDLGADGPLKKLLHTRLLNHLKKHRRAGRTFLRFGYEGGSRDVNCLLFFGFTLGELVTHIGGKFTDGMTWDRVVKGEVQIDHILPTQIFDLTTTAGVKRAYALENSQPLWRSDNARKGKTSDTEIIQLFGAGTIRG